LEAKVKGKVERSSVESMIRIAQSRSEVSQNLAQKDVHDGLARVVRPRSISSGVRKAGIALMLAPDPITDIPGIFLLASAHLLKKRDPLSVWTLMKETRRVIRDVELLNI